jgi:hypothetical protein
MKILHLLPLGLLLVSSAFAATPAAAPADSAPPVTNNITVPTTASELANGYAQAVQLMTLKSLVIYIRSEGKIVPIKGVRTARAMGAVLLIEFSAGDRMAINAEQILLITDGARTP